MCSYDVQRWPYPCGNDSSVKVNGDSSEWRNSFTFTPELAFTFTLESLFNLASETAFNFIPESRSTSTGIPNLLSLYPKIHRLDADPEVGGRLSNVERKFLAGKGETRWFFVTRSDLGEVLSHALL